MERRKFLGALAQHTYWFLIMRSDLKVKRGDVAAVKGKKIGAAPLIDIGLIELLKECGMDPKRDNVQIAPPPMPAQGQRLVRRQRSEGDGGGQDRRLLGQRHGRRSGGASAASVQWCWMRDAATGRRVCGLYLRRAGDSRRHCREEPEKAAAAVRALVKTQKALKADPKRATKVGEKWFPAFEASLIATLIERDLPFYDPAIPRVRSTACASSCKRSG